MKNIEINKKVEPKGTVAIEGEYTTLRFERQLSYSSEIIWKAITDPKELVGWMNTNAVINGRNGGTIDFVNTFSGFHTIGRILVWNPLRVFEHEWYISPNPSLPNGESESVIRWELKPNDNSSLNTKTLLTLTHSRLTKLTSSWFAPGWHAYLDRLEASLDNEVPPDWMKRFAEVKELYSSWRIKHISSEGRFNSYNPSNGCNI
jgi:uncharacterized protein YndB with AHSA1/START domain